MWVGPLTVVVLHILMVKPNWNTASKLFAAFGSFTHLLSLLAASDVGLNSRAD